MFLFLKYSQSVFAKYLAARVSQFRPGIFLVSWHEAGPSLVISGVPCPDPELRKGETAEGEAKQMALHYNINAQGH